MPFWDKLRGGSCSFCTLDLSVNQQWNKKAVKITLKNPSLHVIFEQHSGRTSRNESNGNSPFRLCSAYRFLRKTRTAHYWDIRTDKHTAYRDPRETYRERDGVTWEETHAHLARQWIHPPHQTFNGLGCEIGKKHEREQGVHCSSEMVGKEVKIFQEVKRLREGGDFPMMGNVESGTGK